MQYKLRVASGLNLPWYGSMEWNMEEHFKNGMEDNCQYGIWKSRLPFHTMPWVSDEALQLVLKKKFNDVSLKKGTAVIMRY